MLKHNVINSRSGRQYYGPSGGADPRWGCIGYRGQRPRTRSRERADPEGSHPESAHRDDATLSGLGARAIDAYPSGVARRYVLWPFQGRNAESLTSSRYRASPSGRDVSLFSEPCARSGLRDTAKLTQLLDESRPTARQLREGHSVFWLLTPCFRLLAPCF